MGIFHKEYYISHSIFHPLKPFGKIPLLFIWCNQTKFGTNSIQYDSSGHDNAILYFSYSSVFEFLQITEEIPKVSNPQRRTICFAANKYAWALGLTKVVELVNQLYCLPFRL